MRFLERLLKDGAEAAATMLGHVAVTGADIIDNAEKRRKDLGRTFDEKAMKATEKVDRLVRTFEDHLTAFADALDAAVAEAREERRSGTAPAPQSTVSEVTPETVAATKPGVKTPAAATQQAPAEAVAKPGQPRKRAARTPKKPSL